LVKSISYSEEEILNWILTLHCSTEIELDPTYSKGNFYKGSIKDPLYKYDLYPQREDVIECNAEKLPLGNETINTMIFDPPFFSDYR